ncbi:MAG: serine/threonine-protein kinase, partial [Gemmatimonadales bacterium]
GERLAQLAPTAGLPDRLRIFERICETVAFAHAHGVIHRDLKPANVMVGPFGEVLVLDWGVARVLREPAAADPGPADTHRVDAETTAPGTVMGTPGYMAPEQALGDINAIDQRTDVYGLGAILHYLLLGARPDQSPAGRPAEISRPLWAIMRRALEADPGDRYPGASELAVDIARFRDGEPVSALPEGPLARTGRFISRYRTPILLVLAYLVMRVVVLVVAGR